MKKPPTRPVDYNVAKQNLSAGMFMLIEKNFDNLHKHALKYHYDTT